MEIKTRAQWRTKGRNSSIDSIEVVWIAVTSYEKMGASSPTLEVKITL